MTKPTVCIALICLSVFSLTPKADASLWDGLTGYWPLDALNAEDASGNGLDGTVSGIVEATEDRFGTPDGAMLFAGFAEDYVDLGDTEELRIAGPMTLAAWVVLDGGNTNNGRIISKSGAGGNRSWSLNIESGNSDPTFQVAVSGDTNLSVRDVDPLPQDEWVHMAGIYRPGQQTEIYVNGQLKDVMDVDVPDSQFSDNGLPVLIGARNQCGNCGWMGSIDDVAVWSRALNADEILRLFEDGLNASVPGDFSQDGVLNVADINDLTMQSASGLNPAAYDLNHDNQVDQADVEVWIGNLYVSWMGDANLDGEFNSGDLVVVLSSGTYEADVDAAWSSGDFNGDGRTNSSDLVAALAGGGYEQGPRPAVAVPEPWTARLLLSGMPLAALTRVLRRH